MKAKELKKGDILYCPALPLYAHKVAPRKLEIVNIHHEAKVAIHLIEGKVSIFLSCDPEEDLSAKYNYFFTPEETKQISYIMAQENLKKYQKIVKDWEKVIEKLKPIKTEQNK